MLATLRPILDGARAQGVVQYFESFYDFIPHHDDGIAYDNSALSSDERVALQELSAIVDMACDGTPQDQTGHEFIATGWPQRIQRVAEGVLSIMPVRGRFHEDIVECEPPDRKASNTMPKEVIT